MRFLRQNTATRVTVGPFSDKTDGITPEVSLTVTNEKLTFMVDDAGVPTLVINAAPTASGGNNDMVHVTSDTAGFYDLELTAAQTNYVGRAMLALADAANHCPVFHEFMLVPAAVYDALFGTAKLPVDVDTIKTRTVTCGAGVTVLASVGTADPSTAQTGDAYASLAGLFEAVDAVDEHVDLVEDDTQDLRAQIGIAGAGLTALPVPTAAQNATGLLDLADGVETSWTLRQALRIMLSALGGKLFGAATASVAIRDVGDSKDRIAAVVDEDGNRTSVTYEKD